jgi:Fe-S-cluster containining protein
MGFGRSKDEKPSAIAVYRMKNKTCPFLEIRDFRLRCAIYGHRPLVCQAFPVIALNPIRLSANCRVLREKLGEDIELDGLESEIEAMTEIYAHMRKFPGRPRFFEDGSWK